MNDIQYEFINNIYDVLSGNTDNITQRGFMDITSDNELLIDDCLIDIEYKGCHFTLKAVGTTPLCNTCDEPQDADGNCECINNN